METANFRKTLIYIAQQEPDERIISKIIAFFYPRLDLKDKSTLFDSLMNLLAMSENKTFDFSGLNEDIEKDKNIVNPDIFKGKDYRIKNIEISNLRGIPSLEESQNIPYGINFIEDGICHNAVVLANNGTGKSSLFAGIEMIYANEIGEKKLRTKKDRINESEYDNYLKRFPQQNKPNCKIETFDGDFSLEKKIFTYDYIDIFNPVTHFITEFDIIENGRIDYENSEQKLDYSFHNIIAKALGLNEFLDILTVTQQIPTYSRRKELNQQNKLADEIKANEETVKNRLALIQSKQIELDELKKGIESNRSFLNNIELINELKKTIDETPFINIDSSLLKKEIETYQEAYQNYISISGIHDSYTVKGFLEQGLSLLEKQEDCPFCQDSNKHISKIIEDVNTRIQSLKKHEETERKIKLSYRDLTNILFTSIQTFKNATEKIFSQRSVLFKRPRLDDLINKEGVLMMLTSNLIDDELSDFLKSLSEKQFPTEDDFSKLSKFAMKNKELIYEFLPTKIDEIKTFLTQRTEQIQKEIEVLSNSTETSINDKIKTIENELAENKATIPTFEKRISELNLQLESAKQLVDNLKRIKEEIRFFNLKLIEEKDRIVKDYFITIKDVIEKIMTVFVDENEKIKIVLDLEKIERKLDGEIFNSEIIVAKIIQEDGKHTTPDIYFNTFRYKVFCLMISLSIALSTRMRYKINLPLVMDDLFFASDFISKNSFSLFLQKIIALFYKYTPDMPLQFILFTHDDLIFRSALDAVDDFCLKIGAENSKRLGDKTFLARMFSLDDKGNPETMNDGRKYWNLIYTLPKEIKIFKEL